MSRAQIVASLVLVLALVANGGRVSVNKHVEGMVNAGTDKIIWAEGDTFICAQKWEKRTAKFVGHFCLVNLAHVKKGTEAILAAQGKGKATPRIRASHPSMCVSRSQPHKMNVCKLKGEEDMRVHYSGRAAVPQSCFRMPKHGFTSQPVGKQAGVEHEIPVFQVALDFDDCKKEAKKPKLEQRKLQKEAPVQNQRAQYDAGLRRFQEVDLNGDGVVSMEEHMARYTLEGVDLSDEGAMARVKQSFDSMDKNGDGVISLAEFFDAAGLSSLMMYAAEVGEAAPADSKEVQAAQREEIALEHEVTSVVSAETLIGYVEEPPPPYPEEATLIFNKPGLYEAAAAEAKPEAAGDDEAEIVEAEIDDAEAELEKDLTFEEIKAMWVERAEEGALVAPPKQ